MKKDNRRGFYFARNDQGAGLAKRERITYLGPSMMTFSALAYEKSAELFGAPRIIDGEESLAGKNEEVLPLVVGHGGYGVIAMETEAEGRIDQNVNTFVNLLNNYQNTKDCKVKVIGAIRMPIIFACMVRPEVSSINDITMVVAHARALGAFHNRIQTLGLKVIESDSNGKAAEDVANKTEFAHAAALGPRIAAEKNELKVLEEAHAITTFFLLGPKDHASQTLSEVNRCLLVFRTKNEPEAIINALSPISKAGLNFRHVRDYYVGNDQYDFATEIECRMDQVDDLSRAMDEASQYMMRHILFGPFPVV